MSVGLAARARGRRAGSLIGLNLLLHGSSLETMRTQQQTARTVIDWLRDGRRVAAGLLASVDGSAPLDVGASVYIDEHGNVEGSITGGCVESAVAQEALDVMETGAAPRLQTYGISDELAGTVGLMCGGN